MHTPRDEHEQCDLTPEQLYGVVEIGDGVEECLVDLAAAEREAAAAQWPEEPPLTPEQLYGVIDVSEGVEECLVEGSSFGPPANNPQSPPANGPQPPSDPTDRAAS